MTEHKGQGCLPSKVVSIASDTEAAMERETGGTCINGTWLDELDPTAGRHEGPIVEECGAMCELLTVHP